MSITYVWPGDLFSAPAQTLVVPVNTVSVMGKGLAADFRTRFPALLDDYRSACRRGDLAVGRCWLWSAGEVRVLCFATKQDWRHPSRLEYVERGLIDLSARYRALGITSLAVPQLGCGLGGLPWPAVRALIATHLAGVDIPVWVYGPAANESGP